MRCLSIIERPRHRAGLFIFKTDCTGHKKPKHCSIELACAFVGPACSARRLLPAGVSLRNIDYWARTKFIVPSIADARKGTGIERKFRSLTCSRCALLESSGEPAFQRNPAPNRWFSANPKGLQQPLPGCRLIVTGSHVQVATSPEKVMSVLMRPGQTSLASVFEHSCWILRGRSPR